MLSLNKLFRSSHVARPSRRSAPRVRLSLHALEVLEDRVQPSTLPTGFGVGHAADYAVLGLQGTNINDQHAAIVGDVGLSGGTFRIGRQSTPVTPVDATASHAAAIQASADAAAFTADITIARSVNRAATVNAVANGNLTVVNINGSINASLTLQGSADSFFIVNVRGNLNLNGRESLGLTGGVKAEHVIYNFIGGRGSIDASPRGVINGTLLAPHYNVNLFGTTVNGEVIAGGAHIALFGGVHVNRVAFANSAPTAATSTVSGHALLDNGFGGFDGYGGMEVTLTGTDLQGNTVSLTTYTEDLTGAYSFADVPAGTYTLHFAGSPFGGTAVAGTAGGTSLDSLTIEGISLLAGGIVATNYDFIIPPNS